MEFSERKRLFGMYDNSYQYDNAIIPPSLGEQLSKFINPIADVSHPKPRQQSSTLDEVVDSTGKTISQNQPSPSNTFDAAANRYNQNGKKKLIDVVGEIVESFLGPYNENNMFAPENWVGGAAIGGVVADKYGRNRPERYYIAAVSTIGSVVVKSYINMRRKKRP